MKARIRKILKHLIRGLIRTYQILISSWMPPRCRFYPSCSQYMLQAVDRFGPFRGTIMGLRRLMKCHPFNDGGYDPLPEE